MRLVGFDAGKQQELASICAKNEPVALENCEIKQSKYGERMEIVVSKLTKVSMSPRKYNKDEILKSSLAPQINIDELSQYADYEEVSVEIKVHSVEEKIEVKPDLWKQEVIVADGSASTKITLWQSDIGKLEPNKSYLINNVSVTSYKGIKSLSASYNCSDIGDVTEPIEDHKEKFEDVHVLGAFIEMNKIFMTVY